MRRREKFENLVPDSLDLHFQFVNFLSRTVVVVDVDVVVNKVKPV